MKEIGTKLKEARESIGVSIEEAAEDLKLKVSQIENLEAGNMEAFQDVFYLKYFIKDYAKNRCNTTTCFMPYINAFFQPRKEAG